MNSPSFRWRRNSPLHPPLSRAPLVEMLSRALDRAVGQGPCNIGVSGQVACLVEVFASGGDHNYHRIHRIILSGTSDFLGAPRRDPAQAVAHIRTYTLCGE